MIDVETLMNDKKLLQEEIKQLKSELKDWKDASHFIEGQLYDVLQQRSDLTNEVMRLSQIVEANGYVDDGK